MKLNYFLLAIILIIIIQKLIPEPEGILDVKQHQKNAFERLHLAKVLEFENFEDISFGGGGGTYNYRFSKDFSLENTTKKSVIEAIANIAKTQRKSGTWKNFGTSRRGNYFFGINYQIDDVVHFTDYIAIEEKNLLNEKYLRLVVVGKAVKRINEQ